jgi:alanine racemase
MTTRFRCWVEISLKQIADNFDAIRNVVTPAVEVMPVTKADACGHGAMEVARVLCARGAGWLAVSSTEEGVRLRDAGIIARILVMADFLPWERAAALEYELTPVIHRLADIGEWNQLNRERGRVGNYHLKIDSGMWRLGTRADAPEIASAVFSCSHARLEGLMTHFASAGDYSSSQTDEQTSYFLRLAADLAEHNVRPKYLHLSGTIPVAYGRTEAWQGMVRPGHAIYGYIATAGGPTAPERGLNVKPALSWKASILAVKDVPTGVPIGYRGTFRAPRPMRVAILAAGYADGIPHQLANRGMVIAGGKLTPMLGAIAMDLTTIDITHAPHLGAGDTVTLLGAEDNVSLDAQQIGQMAGTSSYSVLCGISARVKRVYV